MRETKQRLLRVAAKVFAKNGYRGATIRDIAAAAVVNVAAVNYHFGGKSGLYHQVFEYIFADTGELSPPPGAPAAAGGRGVWVSHLEFLVRRMLEDVIMPSPRQSLELRIIFRELAEPSDMFPELYERYFGPRLRLFKDCLANIHGGSLSQRELSLKAFAIVSRGIFYYQNRHLIERELAGGKLASEDIDAITVEIMGGYSLESVLEFSHNSPTGKKINKMRRQAE